MFFGKVSGNTSDSLLFKYGLSKDFFEITIVKNASKNIFRNLSCDAIKPFDTIIIAKVDTFQNKLDIEGKLIKHKLVLSGKVFKKGISFYNSRFTNEVYLNECIFLDRVNLSHATFDTTLILWTTYFAKAGVFSDATFHDIQFVDTKFEDDVQFNDVHFNSPTYFISTYFKKGALFTDAVFRDYTSFKFCEFEEKPWFWQSVSSDTLVFYSAKLKSGIDFQSSKFGLLLGLNYLESNGRIDFNGVSMPQYTDLSSIKCDKVIDFNYINDSNKFSNYKINIYNVDLNKLLLTNQFSLYFDKYLSIDIKHSIYKQLLDNLIQKGYKDIYKSFDIEYKGFVNKHYNHYSEKVLYHINRIWWNFGYNKHRVFLWTLIFIFIFSIPFRIWIKLFVGKVYEYKKLFQRYNANRQINNWVRSFFGIIGLLLSIQFLFSLT